MRKQLLLLFVIMALLIGSATFVGAQDDELVFGLSVPSASGQLYASLVEGAQIAADDLSIELVVLEAGDDLELEASNVASLVDQGVNALLFEPVSASDSLASLEAASAAGIPIFLLGDGLEIGDAELEIASTIGLDNAAAAEFAAQSLCESVGEGAVLQVVGERIEVEEDESLTAAAQLEADRSAAFEAYIDANCADITLETVDLTGLDAAGSLNALREVVVDGVSGVFAYSDSDLILAMRAAILARISDITLMGFNLSEDTLGAIEIGRVNGVITSLPSSVGELAVQTAYSFVSGETVEKNVYAITMLVNFEALEALESTVRWNCPPNICPPN
jgi:ABC-type sugar transport system substrate-binding protein